MKLSIRLLLIFLLVSVSRVSNAESFLTDAEKYAVRVKSSISYPFAEDKAGTFNGAGFLIDKERGWFLTNAHVSGRGSGDIEISFKGQKFKEAELIYVDPELDFSILSLPSTEIADFAIEAALDCMSDQISGAEVAAFGHPHDLYYSASRGIISRVRFYEGHDWVQVDAAINPGNSGGPLIELQSGKVVGINAMGLKDSEGLNFAVPLGPVCKAVHLLKDNKNPSPPKLPFSFAADHVRGTYLTVAGNRYGELPKGVKVGDVLLKVNGAEVETPTEVATILRGSKGKAKFTFEQSETQTTIELDFPMKPLITDRLYLFMDGAVIAEDRYLERFEQERNFMFHSVRDGSYADRFGFRKGEIIIAIDGIKPNSVEHLKELLDGDDFKEVITRHWSSIDNQFYDYYVKDYSPGYVDLL